MRIAMFYQSLVSDWNHGNAHFLRGVASDLQARGHAIEVFEPVNNWSRENLFQDAGQRAIDEFSRSFPHLQSTTYHPNSFNLEGMLDDVDLVLVHEWNDPVLVSAAGAYRRLHPETRLLFHDTHHRMITAEHEMARYNLDDYDGVLAYGGSLRDAYQRRGWGKQVYVWHEAADTRVFYPRPGEQKTGDLVWIGNWGDDERTEELREFFMNPVVSLSLKAHAHGVRYPATALRELRAAGIEYCGWLPNFQAPIAFARHHVTIHVPRRPYTKQLPGIPTIRPFEALACGIPLVSAAWDDCEGLFRIGRDFLKAQSGPEMERHLSSVLHDPQLASELSRNGLETIRARHTCCSPRR